MVTRQAYQGSCLLGDLRLVGLAGNGDAASAAELEQAIVAQATQGTEHGVGIDAHHRGQVARGWESVTGSDLPVLDCAPDRRGSLVVQGNGARLVQSEIGDGTSIGSFIDRRSASRGGRPRETRLLR